MKHQKMTDVADLSDEIYYRIVDNYDLTPYTINVDWTALRQTILAKDFLFVWGIFAFTGLLVILSAWVNEIVVDVEAAIGIGLTLPWFFVSFTVIGFLAAVMVITPYRIDQANCKYYTFWAIIFYCFALLFWSVALFHSLVGQGTAGVASIILLAATIWLGWVCYHLHPNSILIFFLLLFWTYYLITYTYNVGTRNWIATPLPIP